MEEEKKVLSRESKTWDNKGGWVEAQFAPETLKFPQAPSD